MSSESLAIVRFVIDKLLIAGSALCLAVTTVVAAIVGHWDLLLPAIPGALGLSLLLFHCRDQELSRWRSARVERTSAGA